MKLPKSKPKTEKNKMEPDVQNEQCTAQDLVDKLAKNLDGDRSKNAQKTDGLSVVRSLGGQETGGGKYSGPSTMRSPDHW